MLHLLVYIVQLYTSEGCCAVFTENFFGLLLLKAQTLGSVGMEADADGWLSLLVSSPPLAQWAEMVQNLLCHSANNKQTTNNSTTNTAASTTTGKTLG